MTLRARIDRLDDAIPRRRRRRTAVVPTGSLAEFARGLLAGAFTFADLDRTDYDQAQVANLFGVALVALGPPHQAYCDAHPWARRLHDEWERTALGALTPAELGVLRGIARPAGPPAGSGPQVPV